MNRIVKPAAAMMLVAMVSGCQSTYYGTMERLGVHKRDILVDRIEDARDDQNEAKEQIKTAMERFTEVVEFDGGELKKTYNRLQTELNRSEASAKDVRTSIEKVENVSDALFKEWEKEIKLYSNDTLRRESTQTMDDTRSRYVELIDTVRRTESSLEPVLVAFRDQVLFLKHNLNSQAILSLQNELVLIENEVQRLVQQMEISIAEANTFIEQMNT